jgi:hypothetical protein
MSQIEEKQPMPSRTPTTKRSVQSPAKPITEQPTAITRPSIPLSIDQITEAVSEILATGANENVLESLLINAIEHITRRTYERGIGTDDKDVIDKAINREIGHHLNPWKQDIMAEWRRNRRQPPTAIEPKTITERIRANDRNMLESQMEEFLGGAVPEEVRFLRDVLVDWENRCYRGPSDSHELYLGMAFEWQLNTPPQCYMRIPEHLVHQVQKYVDALRAIENRAA